MPDAQDMDLMREFARHNSEAAFTELVRRHIALVYSVARRCTGNDGDAQDVTQAVFIILARKAAGLRERTLLPGWLYETTRFTAARLLRTNARRQQREQEAYMQSTLNEADTADVWEELSPHLEAAMSKLAERDRALLVLRFYQNRSGPQAAALMGIREDAAQKRVRRAIEKLRKFFAQRGVTLSGEAIAKQISTHSVQAVPVTMVKTISAVAFAKGVTASASTLTLIKGALKIMAWTKAKTAIMAGAAILIAATTTIITLESIYAGKPSYHGKTLTALLEECKDFVYIKATDTPAERRQKEVAVQTTCDAARQMGTNAIPILLQWVANTTNGGGNILAANCIKALGPKAEAAVPDLIKMLDSDNEMARYAALEALQRIGPSADQAFAAILNHIRNDTSERVRSFAVATLASHDIAQKNHGVVVPILTECLAPTNKAINRPDALRALADVGQGEGWLVPPISPCLNDLDPTVRNAAADALLFIDPHAPSKQ